MNSITKKLPLVFSVSAALSLALLTIYQSGIIADLREVLSLTDKKFKLTEQALNQELENSENLRNELTVYKDSIESLHLEIARLTDKIEEQKSVIKSLNASIQKQEAKVAQLSGEIERLNHNKRKNEEKIKLLVQERDELLKKMEDADRQRIAAMDQQRLHEQQQSTQSNRLDELNTQVDKKQEQLNTSRIQAIEPVINQSPVSPEPVSSVNEEMSKIIKNRQQERLKNILTQTTAKFTGITLRNRENSNELKKIKDSGNGWRYTFIDFDLDNPDREAIMDETFIVQIFDLDNGQVVPMNERNPNFPESEQGAIGYKFKYEGKPVSIRYFNTQKKEGSNFEIRLVYFKNGLTFQLTNGSRKIVENGLVIVS